MSVPVQQVGIISYYTYLVFEFLLFLCICTRVLGVGHFSSEIHRETIDISRAVRQRRSLPNWSVSYPGSFHTFPGVSACAMDCVSASTPPEAGCWIAKSNFCQIPVPLASLYTLTTIACCLSFCLGMCWCCQGGVVRKRGYGSIPEPGDCGGAQAAPMRVGRAHRFRCAVRVASPWAGPPRASFLWRRHS